LYLTTILTTTQRSGRLLTTTINTTKSTVVEVEGNGEGKFNIKLNLRPRQVQKKLRLRRKGVVSEDTPTHNLVVLNEKV
jgi:hypothetical protein